MKHWWTSVCLGVLAFVVGALYAACDSASSEREPPPLPRPAPVRSSGQPQTPAAHGDVTRPALAGPNPYLLQFEQQRRDIERRLREEPNPYILDFERRQRDLERRLREDPNPYLRPGYDQHR